ncbi:MAG TPA: type VII secretion protein EccB [Candidatus Limnocylindrales bacterium]|nr:type VII secretion protein EccB [Candidatus Limnocylindrales bacterium]
MRSRREQVQAHRFVTRRIVAALMFGEPEAPEPPMRRLILAVVGSVLVAAIVFAGIGIYGLLFPGGRNPAENTLVIERETGAKYVFLQGRLHPVLNFTSARLILGRPDPPTQTMSSRSLLNVPRGRTVGIANAPDTLPPRSDLVGLPWSVCSALRSAGSADAATHVFVNAVPAGGAALVDRGLLVASGTDRIFLLWHDHRLRVRGNTVLAALEWTSVDPITVNDAFLNAVPPGPDLAAAAVTGAGRPWTRTIGGRAATVGDVYRAGRQAYLLHADGLSPVGETMSRLLLAGGRPAIEISAQEAGAALSQSRIEPQGFPDAVPDPVRSPRPSMACAGYLGPATGSTPNIVVETHERVADAFSVPPDQAALSGSDGVVTADRVNLPGGHAAVVRALQDNASGLVYVVTDQGLKHPLPLEKSEQILGSLGFAGYKPVVVPASILALIPTAPALDPDAATRFTPVPTVSPSRPPNG